MAADPTAKEGGFYKWIWVPVVGTLVTFGAKMAYEKLVKTPVKSVLVDSPAAAPTAPQTAPSPVAAQKPNVPDGTRFIADD